VGSLPAPSAGGGSKRAYEPLRLVVMMRLEVPGQFSFE
jgi:hypothetical protein